LPESVRGTASTAITSLGTCRGEQSSRTRLRISPITSSLNDAPSRSTTNSGIHASSPSTGTSTTSASVTASTAITAR